ncbi:MAG TPA: cytochrome C oxidase subunit IV family protein [Candidatus Krumholzibacteria bacterium]|nr:cytochrome C oxidase subunit IV family protein [Candidatus Krumholzibacteria bacterium]HRX51900.1 cytochrome C oxidase subunit IV family protein [Candidatus Krumholzibacteria bacterium]
MSNHGNDKHPSFGHVAPLWVLFATFGALIVLTLLTYAAAMVNLGPLNVPVAIGIALVKATLVALFFMHLFWDNKFNAFVLVCGLIFVALFIGIALLDTTQYKPDMIPDYAPLINNAR